MKDFLEDAKVCFERYDQDVCLISIKDGFKPCGRLLESMKIPCALFTALALVAACSLARAGENWKPLWNGKTFAAWHVIGKGEWKIIDGVIRGAHAKEEKEFGHIVTDKTYRDFTVRLKYKAVKGNSGLYFRVEEKGFSGVTGFQAEIDPEKDAGGLYETNGRSWVSQPKPDDVKRWFKPGQWNEMSVSAHGGHIVVLVNGIKSAELKDDPGRHEGKFALQVHAGQDCEVWFKDIEIMEP